MLCSCKSDHKHRLTNGKIAIRSFGDLEEQTKHIHTWHHSSHHHLGQKSSL
ncbi:unnamed protein product [Prunus brigantina]